MLKPLSMLKSDLKSAFRSILRNKVTSAISIIGLGIGLGCIIVLTALIIHEKSFDKFIPDYKNVYRIILGNSSQTQYPLAETMAREFPEVKDFFRYYQAGSIQVRNANNEIVRENDFGFADRSIYRILGIEFLSGSPANSGYEIAISEETAKKYFNRISPIGEVIQAKFADGFTALSVSGVYKDFPANSSLNPSMLADIELSEKMFMQWEKSLGQYGNDANSKPGWKYSDFCSFIVLHNNSDIDRVTRNMEKYKEFVTLENKDELHYRLQPVSDIYLGSRDITGNYFMRRGNPEDLKYYEAISILILIISIANYIFLARAGVSDRSHELGTRKVFGASFGNIRKLILVESNLVVIMSLILAVFIIDFGMDFINNTLNKTMTGQVFLNPVLWGLLFLIIVFTGTVSGWLIGFNYSRIPVMRLITGQNLSPGKSGRWNFSFLVLHFAIYMILISSVIVVSKQIHYSLTGYQGYNPENIIVADLNTDELKSSYQAISQEMKRIPGVINVAGGTFIPPFGSFLPVNLATPNGDKVRFDGLIMGEGMPELLGMEVVEGSTFEPFKPGPPEVLLNESAAKEHNVKAGEQLLAFNVRGIIRDFNAHSMHSLIRPLVILPQNPEKMGLIAIKTDGKNDQSVIKRLRELYSAISPDEIFETAYLTDNLHQFYQSETNQLKIIGAFTLIAAILSIMGLFGISLMSISKKFKEIGIRKVNGASTKEILQMLNIEFIKWILVSTVISIPVSIWLVSQWMNRFAYKTKLSWWIFALAVFSAILIAVFTISWQSWRAATKNPVEALRYE
jgi:putative ABC transport system permease protein